MKDPNSFRVVIPAQLEKSSNGEWKVAGLASTQSMDQQGETIMQKGMDLTPIEQKKGLFNWDHDNSPESTIGVIDGYKQDHERGLYVHGRLFKNHSKAKAVHEIMSSLGDRDRGRIGMSVEGKVIERDKSNPKRITKCQIRNVALTMNPVNSGTFADLMKSMSSGEVEFNSDGTYHKDPQEEPKFTASQVFSMMEKALGVGAGYTQAPDSRTGGDALSQEEMDKKKKDQGLQKKQGVPEGVDPAKHERCVQDLKDQGHDKESAIRICNDSLRGKVKKAEDGGPCWEGYERVPGTKKYEDGSCRKKKMKKMNKKMYKSALIGILDKLQTLYPENSRMELWESVKDRLDTRYPDISRVFNKESK